MATRRELITSSGVVVAGVLAGCAGGVANLGSQERCTEATVESYEWKYTVLDDEDKDTVITEVTNYADVGGEITLKISVWGQKDDEDLLDTESRTRYVDPKSTDTFELKFYPTDGVESVSVAIAEQACSTR